MEGSETLLGAFGGARVRKRHDHALNGEKKPAYGVEWPETRWT